MSSFINKYKESNRLLDIVTEYLNQTDPVGAIPYLKTTIAIYQDILDKESLTPAMKILIESKLVKEKEKLRLLRMIIKKKKKSYPKPNLKTIRPTKKAK
jgi:hypothetical protein